MKKQFIKVIVPVIMLLLVVHISISFSKKILIVNWQAELSTDVAGFKLYNNGTDLVADVVDPAARSYTGPIIVMLSGVDTDILTEDPNIISVRQYDFSGNVSADSLPATVRIINVAAPLVPANLRLSVGDI